MWRGPCSCSWLLHPCSWLHRESAEHPVGPLPTASEFCLENPLEQRPLQAVPAATGHSVSSLPWEALGTQGPGAHL